MKKTGLTIAILMLPAILIAQTQKSITPNAAAETTLAPVLSGQSNTLEPSTLGTTQIINDHSIVTVIHNPFSLRAFFVFENKNRNNYRLILFNTEGKIVRDKNVNEEKVFIEKENLKTGLYFFKLIPVEEGSVLMGKFIIE